MREVKLPHLPSDVEARNKDLMTDLWYKGKETQIKQDKKVIKIKYFYLLLKKNCI